MSDYGWMPEGVTDQMVAFSCLDAARNGYRYLADTATWVRRTDDSWEECGESSAETAARIVSELAALIPEGKKPEGDSDDSPEASEWRMRMRFQTSARASGISAKIRSLAPSHPIAARAAELDTDTRVLWCSGEPWSLTTASPATSVPDDTVHLLSARYRPVQGATPLWDAWTRAVWPDSEVREWVLNMMGATLTGGGKRIPVLVGPHNAGKTSTVVLLRDLLGTYAVHLPEELLTGQATHSEVFVRLRGARLAYFDETPGKSRTSQQRLKSLAGGGTQTGRAAYGRKAVTFEQTHTLWLMTNDEVPLTDPALVSRVQRVPCEGDSVVIKAAGREIWDGARQLTPAWRREAPAVLASLIERCAVYLGDDSVCDAPASALVGLSDAIAEQDTVHQWVAACTVAEGESAGLDLHTSYTAWCRDHGVSQHESLNITAFGRRLTQLGYRPRKTMTCNMRPLRLRAPMLGGRLRLPMRPIPSMHVSPGQMGCMEGMDGQLSIPYKGLRYLHHGRRPYRYLVCIYTYF